MLKLFSVRPASTARPLVLIALAATIPVIILTGWIALVNARHDRADARIRATNSLDRIASEVRSAIRINRRVLEGMAASDGVTNADESRFRREAIKIIKTNSDWKQITLLSSDGTERFGEATSPVMDVQKMVPPEALSALQRDERAEVTVYWRDHKSDPLQVFSVATDRGSERGPVLVALIGTAAINTILSGSIKSDQWRLWLLDGDGRIVARNTAAEADVSEKGGIGDVVRASDDDEIETISVPLGGSTRWSVRLDIPRADLDRDVFRTVVLLFASAGGGLVLAMILAWYSARDISYRKAQDDAQAKRALSLSEERRLLAISTAELGVFSWDHATRSLTASRRTCELFEMSMADENDIRLTADSVLSSIDRLDQPRVRSLLDAWSQEGHTAIEFRTKAGRWLRLSGRSYGGRNSVFGVVRDVDAEKRLELERLQLIRRVSDAQENDRKRISRELHDQVGQLVTGLLLGLKKLEKTLSVTGNGRPNIDDVKGLSTLASEIGKDIHRAAADLRPATLDHLGLDSALEALCSEWSRRSDLQIDLQCVGGRQRLAPDVEIALFRIVQEAINNVLKHADATCVSVVLERWSTFTRLIVEDDGKGFEPRPTGAGKPLQSSQSLGLSGIQERLALIGGYLTIETGFEKGTTLFIVVPSV